MIAIRSAIPLAILLGVSVALCQQAPAAPSPAPVAAPAASSQPAPAAPASVVVEEEEVMGDEAVPVSKDSAVAQTPPASPAPTQPAVKSEPAKTQAADTALFVGEGEEDIFTNDKAAAPAGGEPAANTAGTAAQATEPATSAPKYEEYDRGQRYRGRYSGAMPKEETPQVKSGEIVNPPNAAAKPVETVKPAVIEQVHSINFAKNLKEYRSPKAAMFMSLLLPGLGQAYTQRYVKAGIFGAIEIALVSASVKFAVDGSRKKKDAQSFADLHFDPTKFREHYNNLRTHITNTETKVLPAEANIPDEVNAILTGIGYDTTEFFSSAAARSVDYYSTIEQNSFSAGWDDNEPWLQGTGDFVLESDSMMYDYIPYSSDTTWMLRAISKTTGDTLKEVFYGYSGNQNMYDDMVDQSDNSYKWSQTMGMILIVNHVVSAVDALLSAKRHNDELLGKHSFLHNVSLDNQVAFSGRDVITKVGMRVRF
jgi:hypothetical protein